MIFLQLCDQSGTSTTLEGRMESFLLINEKLFFHCSTAHILHFSDGFCIASCFPKNYSPVTAVFICNQ